MSALVPGVLLNPLIEYNGETYESFFSTPPLTLYSGGWLHTTMNHCLSGVSCLHPKRPTQYHIGLFLIPFSIFKGLVRGSLSVCKG
jgi:hypothetical protein